MNVIMRVAWNRPEMLQVSIEHEVKAREYYTIDGDFITIFVVDYNPPEKTLEIISKYPFPKKVLIREKPLGLTPNILRGMKIAFKFTDDYIIYLEDDICVHETYFEFLDKIMNMDNICDYSIISAYNKNDDGNVNEIYKGHHYCACGPLITRKFFEEYIVKHAHADYYGTFKEEHKNFGVRANYINTLNETYKDHSKAKEYYKYMGSGAHNEQAGLINRLVDIALMEKDWWVIMPRVNRQQHIGYYGKNRPGGVIPGRSYEERLENLKEIIKSSDKMYELSSTKQYNDYLTFSPKLDGWDGTLRLTNE